MRKWKDEGSNILKPNTRKLIIFTSLGIMIMIGMGIMITRTVTFQDIFVITLSAFNFWGVHYNGYYKLGRRYMEWHLKRKDNNWRYGK